MRHLIEHVAGWVKICLWLGVKTRFDHLSVEVEFRIQGCWWYSPLLAPIGAISDIVGHPSFTNLASTPVNWHHNSHYSIFQTCYISFPNVLSVGHFVKHMARINCNENNGITSTQIIALGGTGIQQWQYQHTNDISDAQWHEYFSIVGKQITYRTSKQANKKWKAIYELEWWRDGCFRFSTYSTIWHLYTLLSKFQN